MMIPVFPRERANKVYVESLEQPVGDNWKTHGWFEISSRMF